MHLVCIIIITMVTLCCMFYYDCNLYDCSIFVFFFYVHYSCSMCACNQGRKPGGKLGGGRWQTAFGSKLLTRKNDRVETSDTVEDKNNKEAVLPQGNRAMPQVFFSVEVRQQHSLQV